MGASLDFFFLPDAVGRYKCCLGSIHKLREGGWVGDLRGGSENQFLHRKGGDLKCFQNTAQGDKLKQARRRWGGGGSRGSNESPPDPNHR